MTADAEKHPELKETNGTCMFVFHYVVSVIANGIVCGGAIALWSTLGFADTVFAKLADYSWYAPPTVGLAFLIFLVLYLLDFFWPPHLQPQLGVLYDGDRCVGRVIFGVGMVIFVVGCILYSYMIQSLPLLINIMLCPVAVYGCHMIYDPFLPREEEEHMTKRKSDIVNSDDVHAKMSLLHRITGEEMDTHMFYKAAVAAFLTTFVWTLVTWIVGTLVMGPPLLDLTANLTQQESQRVYIQWSAPLVVSVANLVFGLVSYLRVIVHQTYSRTNKYKNKILADFMHSALVEEMTDHRVELMKKARHSQVDKFEAGAELEKKRDEYLEQDLIMAQNLSNIIKGCICVFIVLIGLGYAAMNVLSSNQGIAEMVMGIVCIFFVFFCIFTYISLQRIVLAMGKWLQEMPAWKTISTLAKHDIVKAATLSIFAPFIPGILLVSVVNQLVRKCRKVYENYPDIAIGRPSQESADSATKPTPETLLLTPRVHNVIVSVRSWDWISIVTKVYLLCCLYVAYAICFPLLNVALSALRKVIEDMGLHFAIILLAVFLIGVLCFLCPTVPGMIVYIFAGILVADQCPPRHTDQGFWTGVVVNFALCWILKLMACAIQQVCIGGMLSKSLWVRRTVGVHTTFIRCLEVVMRKKGLSPGKVAILCGGPDWPTSVLAGIMKLSLVECEIGTLPIIGFIVPFALTGSFYLKSSDPTSMLASASSLMLVLSMAVTGVLWAVSAWAVQQALEQNREEVTRPLAQNVDLEWLDYRDSFVKEKLQMKWGSIPMGVRAVWVLGALVHIFVCHCLQWLYTRLIGAFTVSDPIESLVFIGGFDPTKGLFTYQAFALLGLYCGCWLPYIVYSVWKRRAVGPAYREAVKECNETEAKWKDEYIKLCEEKAKGPTNKEIEEAGADAKAAAVEAQDEIGDANRGISVYV